ncbi:MAG TPA: hypothetical protein DCR44_04720, partial [Acholeplasmatales bacterium]|nr:hypothetical protein [Acholeplasmatales bacterium]
MEKFVELAIENIIKEGTTDVELFNPFYEVSLLKKPDVKSQLIAEISGSFSTSKLEDLHIKKYQNVLVPKGTFSDFRKCALIDVVDEIKYLSLVLSVASKIEKNRLKVQSNRVFSYRLKLDDKEGYIFSPNYNYTAFKNYVSQKMLNTKYKVLVKCDIANFYDRLNLHRLESILMSIKDIDQIKVGLINELLLFWANRDSYGLPVGSNASRILAEAALIDVDKYMISQNIDFVRFVDDYRIFAPDSESAQIFLGKLINKLNSEGLFLNNQKTDIIDLIIHRQNKKDDIYRKSFVKETPQDQMHKVSKIIRGYSGVIPTRFKDLTVSEIALLIKINPQDTFLCISEKAVLDPKETIRAIKIFIASNRFDLFLDACPYLFKYPQLLPFYINAYLKYESKISQNEKYMEKTNEMKRRFLTLFDSTEYLEYVQIYAARLFSGTVKNVV